VHEKSPPKEMDPTSKKEEKEEGGGEETCVRTGIARSLSNSLGKRKECEIHIHLNSPAREKQRAATCPSRKKEEKSNPRNGSHRQCLQLLGSEREQTVLPTDFPGGGKKYTAYRSAFFPNPSSKAGKGERQNPLGEEKGAWVKTSSSPIPASKKEGGDRWRRSSSRKGGKKGSDSNHATFFLIPCTRRSEKYRRALVCPRKRKDETSQVIDGLHVGGDAGEGGRRKVVRNREKKT